MMQEETMVNEASPVLTNAPEAEYFLPEEVPVRTLRAIVAGILEEQGRTVFYVGTPERIAELEADPISSEFIPVDRRAEMRPVGDIVRSARKAVDAMIVPGSGANAVLGVLSLPEVTTEELMQTERRNKGALILDGLDVNDPDVATAVQGIKALLGRMGHLLAVFP